MPAPHGIVLADARILAADVMRCENSARGEREHLCVFETGKAGSRPGPAGRNLVFVKRHDKPTPGRKEGAREVWRIPWRVEGPSRSALP